MKISNPKNLKNKQLIVFDLDGTLAPSKSAMDSQMVNLLMRLLQIKKVAVISGGNLKQYKLELLDPFRKKKFSSENLYLFPTSASIFYKWQKGVLRKVYEHALTKSQVAQIRKAFAQTFSELNYKHPKITYGQIIENRQTQISFSALGQDVVAKLGKKGVVLKELWAKTNDIRPQMLKILKKLLPDLEVRIGGLTTIDITKKGIDKAYGVRQISRELKIPISKMLFVGDAIFPGGNDYAALKTGIDYAAVNGPSETKTLIKNLI